MFMKNIVYFSFLLTNFLVCNVYSQSVSPINYDRFIEEVYSGTPYMTDELKAIYTRNMSMVVVKKWDGEKYPYLDQIDLVNKYNPNLKYDIGIGFDNENFNPLKYFFNFKTKQVLIVRDTDYMIVIDPMLIIE